MRSAIELLHIVLGMLAAIAIAELSAWSYPLARGDIWLVALIAMAATASMGVGPLRRAWRVDRSHHAARG